MKKVKQIYEANGNWRLRDNLRYTVWYLFIACSIFAYFFVHHKSLIWDVDGLQQHFNALMYERRWLRHIFTTLFTEHRLDIPLWDMNIGYGSDILTTLNYYVIGDPLNFFVALVPKQGQVEQFYEVLVLLRIYLSGLAFSCYCHTQKKRGTPVLFGSLIYAFSTWTLIGMRHPFFLNPLICLPLLIAGVDRIYAKKKPWLYMGVLTCALMSNFYFAYMLCIIIIFYAIWKYFLVEHKFRLDRIGYWFVRFLGYSLISAATAGVLLLPTVMTMLGTGRLQAKSYYPVIYPLSYYIDFITGYLTGGAAHWTKMGYTALSVLALFVLFSERQRKHLKIAFVLLTILLLFPFFGHLMNGGSYATNRYVWAYTMLVAYILVCCYPRICMLASRHKRGLFLLLMVYGGFCAGIGVIRDEPVLMLQVMFLAAGVALLLYQDSEPAFSRKQFDRIFGGILACSLIFQGLYEFQNCGGKELAEFVDRGKAEAMLTDASAASILNRVKDDGVWRYDQLHTEDKRNTAMALGKNGCSYYFSLANGYVNQLQRELYLDFCMDYRYSNLDGRSALTSLFSVKYYVAPQELANPSFPYLYNIPVAEASILNVKREVQNIALRETQEMLPFGFTSDRYLPISEYEKLTAAQKEQALLQSVVVSDSSLPEASLTLEDRTMAYHIEPGDGVVQNGQQFIVKKKGAKADLCFNGLEYCENYVQFEGFDYQDNKTNPWLDQPADRTMLTVQCGRSKKKLNYRDKYSNFYCDTHDFLINVGYREKAAQKITLIFEKEGVYTYDTLSVICQPMSPLKKQIQARKEDTLQNVQMETNRITGSLDLKQTKLLCLSIPYSEGWTAYIDGKKAQVKQADTAFMAIEVGAGHHEITWCYETPYLRIGLWLSLFGVIAWGMLAFWQKSLLRNCIKIRRN